MGRGRSYDRHVLESNEENGNGKGLVLAAGKPLLPASAETFAKVEMDWDIKVELKVNRRPKENYGVAHRAF